jgi:hypothetical protein
VGAIRARYAGEYRTGSGVVVSILADSDGFALWVAGQPPLPLDPQSATLVQVPAAGASIVFTLDSAGYATALTIRQYGTEVTANRQ